MGGRVYALNGEMVNSRLLRDRAVSNGCMQRSSA